MRIRWSFVLIVLAFNVYGRKRDADGQKDSQSESSKSSLSRRDRVKKRLHSAQQVRDGRPRLNPPALISTINLDDITQQTPDQLTSLPGHELSGIDQAAEGRSYEEKRAVKREDDQPSGPSDQEMTLKAEPTLKQTQSMINTDVSRTEMKKRDAVKQLVDKAANFLKNNPDPVAFNAFTYDPKFRLGDIYIFVYDPDGICLAQGELSRMVWKNDYALKDSFGTEVIQLILREAHSPINGGWVTYQWRNTTKNSYVKEILKDNQRYIVGAGYYPHSKSDSAMSLVKGAVALFENTVKNGLPVEAAFSVMSYPKGRFVKGDLYLFALDFNGLVLAHGERFDTIGTNEIDYKDSQGVMIHREIIQKLKEKGSGVWIEYQSKGASKLTYAERVVDSKGKEYFIACGYYPASSKEQVVDLVVKGAHYLDQNGESQAVLEFSKNKRQSSFVYGDLYLYIFDMDGICLAHGGNQELIGKNLYEAKDQNGFLYVQELIKKAQKGGGWVDYKINNAFFSAYIENVEVGLKNYAVGSGTFPVAQFESQVLLTQSAISTFKDQSSKMACAEFAETGGKFIRGDLGIFVLDTNGIVYVHKDNDDIVWKNMLNARDDTGKYYIKMILEQALKGPGTVNYRLLGAHAIAYVESVEKDGKRFIIGCDGYSNE